MSDRSTANNAKDSGASATVGGYMAFLLFSVAGLARTSCSFVFDFDFVNV